MSVTGAQIEAPSSAETHRTHDAEVVVDDDDDDDPSAGAAGPVSFWPHRFSWRKLWRFTGPGWLMSLAYLDPGNLESDLQQGGYTGYQLLWVLWWATVMGFLLQEMVARLGIVAGRDLAQTVRSEYPRWLCYVVYVMMECAVIGADIQEVVGSAIALNLLTGGFVPVVVGCAITALDTFTFLAVEYLAREDGARWSRHLSPPHTPPATPRRACATSRRSSASSSARWLAFRVRCERRLFTPSAVSRHDGGLLLRQLGAELHRRRCAAEGLGRAARPIVWPDAGRHCLPLTLTLTLTLPLTPRMA